MKIFLAGIGDIHKILDEAQRNKSRCDPIVFQHRPFVLESFFYANADTERLIPQYGDFILDSGAFTFCNTNKFESHKFEEFLERYADFIVRNKVDKFFELDVDSIVGYDKVLQYRSKLERLTCRQSIPVWHFARGKNEYLRHCDEYPYVALGGYVAAMKLADPRQKAYVKAYPWFIAEAHKRYKKIHGLGFTNLEGLKKNHFDSVDSTTWGTGTRFGCIFRFNGREMTRVQRPKGYKTGDGKLITLHNYTEWIKFQRYADQYY